MQTRKSLWILLIILITAAATNLSTITRAIPSTLMNVTPMTITDVSIGNTFVVNVTVTGANKIWGYQIYLKYNTTVLTATDFQNLADLTYAPFKEPGPYSAINDTGGYLVVDYTCPFGDKTGLTSTTAVPLATVTFRVDAAGTSKLELSSTVKPGKTKLVDVNGEAYDPDYNLGLIDGHFSNVGAIKLHDVAIVKIEVSPKEVSPGGDVTISVTVENKGDYNETFMVHAFRSGTYKVGTETITNLAPGETDTRSFTWGTAGVAEGSYPISAKTEIAVDDSPLDNTLEGDPVVIKVPSQGLSFNFLYIAIGIVVVIAVIVAIYVLRRRK